MTRKDIHQITTLRQNLNENPFDMVPHAFGFNFFTLGRRL